MSSATAVPIRPLGRGSLVKLWIAIIVLVLAAAGLALWGTAAWQEVTLESGVRYRTVAAGSGPEITPADVFALRYKLRVGTLDSAIIQDSDQTGRLFEGTTAEVYPGFGEALQHMRKGGRYQLWLPPGTHVSGDQAPPGAPFNARSTLVFEIQVVDVGVGMASAWQMQRLQEMMMMQQQQQQQAAGAAAGGATPPAGGAATPPPAGGGTPPPAPPPSGGR